MSSFHSNVRLKGSTNEAWYCILFHGQFGQLGLAMLLVGAYPDNSARLTFKDSSSQRIRCKLRLPPRPWFLNRLTRCGFDEALALNSTSSKSFSVSVVGVIRISRGTIPVYGACSPEWGCESELQREYLRDPADAYNVRVQGAHLLAPPMEIIHRKSEQGAQGIARISVADGLLTPHVGKHDLESTFVQEAQPLRLDHFLARDNGSAILSIAYQKCCASFVFVEQSSSVAVRFGNLEAKGRAFKFP